MLLTVKPLKFRGPCQLVVGFTKKRLFPLWLSGDAAPRNPAIAQEAGGQVLTIFEPDFA